MLRVTSNSIIVPPLDCAWLSLPDYQLDGSCCLQFECKGGGAAAAAATDSLLCSSHPSPPHGGAVAGENDVTIILKPFPGAKRWQHLQRQAGPAGGEQFAVEANYTVILGSHRNSKLKIEKNGDEKAVVGGRCCCGVCWRPPKLPRQQFAAFAPRTSS